MIKNKKIKQQFERRKRRVRHALKSNIMLPRVSVARSLSHIYAQIIDDVKQHTLISCSSQELKAVTGDKKAIAHAVGIELAKRAKDKGISAAIFDRGGFLYHGRVKSLAEGLREGGLLI